LHKRFAVGLVCHLAFMEHGTDFSRQLILQSHAMVGHLERAFHKGNDNVDGVIGHNRTETAIVGSLREFRETKMNGE
jgi:hypothetical protein